MLWGATVVAVLTLHGAVFSALRLPLEQRARAAPTIRRAGPIALVLLGALAPMTAAGAASAPRLLEGVAAESTLDLLAFVAFPAIPVLIGVQAWMWWVFRHRVGARSAVFF